MHDHCINIIYRTEVNCHISTMMIEYCAATKSSKKLIKSVYYRTYV